MYAILLRQYDLIDDQMVETDPWPQLTVDDLLAAHREFERMRAFGGDAIEDDYLARDLETGEWLTPFDVGVRQASEEEAAGA